MKFNLDGDFRTKNNKRIGKMRIEIEEWFEAILKGLRPNKIVSTTTNPISESNERQLLKIQNQKTMIILLKDQN